ncbi:MAG: hypothetical protein LBV40_03715 [Methanomicrobiales archaeon]|jgi:hypothetical protein|nr:hypothetical protein [Methanomicrobiales archaeon]
MKCERFIAIISIIFLITAGLVTADLLPQPISENQMFSVSSSIEAIAQVMETTSLTWDSAYRGINNEPPVRGGGSLISAESYGTANYFDLIATNGGQIAEVKSFSLDTHGKRAGRYNIETAKILTYTSQNGSHLMGAESFVLYIMGNWTAAIDDGLTCVFAQEITQDTIPAFCNKVTASSKLMSVTTAQVQTIGEMRIIGRGRSVPAALNYDIAVTPDANSASGYADGIFSTAFTVSIMEGRYDGNITDANGRPAPRRETSFGSEIHNLEYYTELAATLTHIDTASVAGGVSTFNKVFNYQSSVDCAGC